MGAIYKSTGDRQRLIDDYLTRTRDAVTTDVAWQRKDGTPIVVRLTAHVVNFEDGLSCFEGIAEDITEKRALEEQLRQALKMEAVGRPARGAAHDFHNGPPADLAGRQPRTPPPHPAQPAHARAADARQAAEAPA